MRTRFAALVAVLLCCCLWSACGSEPCSGESCALDGAGAGADEDIGQVEEALCTRTQCNGYTACLLTDVNNCGACGHHCAPTGDTCSSGVCKCGSGNVCSNGSTCYGGNCYVDCNYQHDCPSGYTCVGDTATNDRIPSSVVSATHGWCRYHAQYPLFGGCSTDADCNPLDPVGVIAGWGAGANDNHFICVNTICYPSATDPHHCGYNDTDICAAGYNCTTCMTYNGVTQGCGGPSCSAGACPHAKSLPGYWRDCNP